jgi:hypothetical protein
MGEGNPRRGGLVAFQDDSLMDCRKVSRYFKARFTGAGRGGTGNVGLAELGWSGMS